MSAPALQQYQNGINQVSGDNLNTFAQVATNAANLRSFVGTTGIQVYMQGFSSIGDGGQGFFYWNSAGTAPDDSGITTVVPNGASSGEWTRLSLDSGSLAAGSFTTITASGALTFTTPSAGIVLKQGANGKYGTFTVNGATPVNVINSSVSITDTIFPSLNTPNGTVGALPAIQTITAGVGFTVLGTAGDTSTYNYSIISNIA